MPPLVRSCFGASAVDGSRILRHFYGLRWTEKGISSGIYILEIKDNLCWPGGLSFSVDSWVCHFPPHLRLLQANPLVFGTCYMCVFTVTSLEPTQGHGGICFNDGGRAEDPYQGLRRQQQPEMEPMPAILRKGDKRSER